MRIETLMSAADAAGYSMVSEELLSENDTYVDNEMVAAEVANQTALSVWQPSRSSALSSVNTQVANAWGWVVGRIAGGATA